MSDLNNLYGQRWMLNNGYTRTVVNGLCYEVQRDSSAEQRDLNAKHSLSLDVGRFHTMPQTKGSIAILGGGPSIEKSLKEIRALSCPVMACGTVHPYLRTKGVLFDYCVIYDPLPVTANYFRNPLKSCTYLVSSTCDPSVFEALKNVRVRLWHPAGDVDKTILGDEKQFIVGGGSTVTLRAIPLAVIMGYSDIHLYGFDSSFVGKEHAYDMIDDDTDHGEHQKVKVNGKSFTTTPSMLIQAQQFMELKDRFPDRFHCTVHGDGMIAEMTR